MSRVPVTDLDVEEVGRRLRALWVTMSRFDHPSHEAMVAFYEAQLTKLFPPETNEAATAGSWAWWAAKILEPTPWPCPMCDFTTDDEAALVAHYESADHGAWPTAVDP